MNNLDESRIEQPSLVQALDKYREMEKVLEEEYDSLQDVIIQSSNEWQGAASKALISEMEYFLNEGDYNTAYENVKTLRMCMEDTLEQVNVLLARSEEFTKQLKSSTYIEPMRPAMGDNTVRNGGVLYLDYGKARLIPGLCDQVYEAAEYLGNVLKQHMEVCNGIMDGIPTYINRVDEAVKNVKRIENYKFSFQKYVQGVMALENDVAVRLAGMKTVETVGGSDATIVKSLDRMCDRDIVISCGKEILEYCLIDSEYENSVERQIIIQFIEEEHSHLLVSLYGADRHSTLDKAGITEMIIQLYNEYNEENHLEQVIALFKDDENQNQYEVYVEYLEYLKIAQYICPAEYDDMIVELGKDSIILNEHIDYLERFMGARNGLLNTLAGKDPESEIKVPVTWKKIEVVTALQIEIEMIEAGYDEAFVYGLIGNMKTEGGKFGGIEGLKNTTEDYGLHVIECVDHLEKYTPYTMMEVNLLELYFDRIICLNPVEESNENGEEPESEIHKWGIGSFQWTPLDRTMPLLEKYLQQVDYTITEDGLAVTGTEKTVITAENYMFVSPVYLTFEQVLEIEMEYLKEELNIETGAFKDVYNVDYTNEATSGDLEVNIDAATTVIKDKYLINHDETLAERQGNAICWYWARTVEAEELNTGGLVENEE